MRMKKRSTTKILKWFDKFQNEEISVVALMTLCLDENTIFEKSQLLLEFFFVKRCLYKIV